jgi:hypothetical protein
MHVRLFSGALLRAPDLPSSPVMASVLTSSPTTGGIVATLIRQQIYRNVTKGPDYG